MENKTVSTGFRCEFTHECVHSKRAKREFGSWSAQYRNSLKNVSITEDYPDVVLPFKVELGSQVYVIWCEWNSGDSFGHGINSGYEAMAVFKDEASALEYSKWLDYLDRNKEEHDYRKKRTFVTSDGQTFSFNGYAPWEGYFESLTQIHIHKAVVGLEHMFDEDSKITFG